MIGAGASGFQIAPTIAPDVEHLTVFQRTAQWMFPNPNYHAAVGPGVRWALRHLPFYGRWYRFLIFWPGCDKGLEAARVDPDYPDQQRAVSEMNELTRQMFTDWIVGQVGDDPGPDRQGGARLPRHRQADPPGQRRVAGRPDPGQRRAGPHRHRPHRARRRRHRRRQRYPADVLVYATGFQATQVLLPMEIVGRDGVDLARLWGERPAGLPRHHRARVPQLLLHVRPRHQPGPRGQPDLPLRVPDALHHPRASRPSSRGLPDDGAPPGPLRGLARAAPGELRAVVWSQPSIEHSFFKNSDGEIHMPQPVAASGVLEGGS